jgi:HK97 family phage prohead protease
VKLTTFAAGGRTLTAAAPGPVAVDVPKRTITGLAVPYGKPGQTGAGRLSFAHGSLSWSDPSRVKLLVEHDQRAEVIGYATELSSVPDVGLMATFHVPESPHGDQALASAAAKLRDGLSVGVQIDDATASRLGKLAGRPGVVAGAGQLREVSLVAVPAFDDARIDSVAAGAGSLVVSSWSDATTQEGSTVDPEDNTNQPASTTQAGPATQPDQPTEGTGNPPARVDNRPPANQPPTATDRPAVVQAAAGMATVVTSEPSTYTFGAAGLVGSGHSLMRDAFVAQVDGDRDAADRMRRYNAELASGNPASVMALAAVAGTTDVPGAYEPTQYRPDLLVRKIDAGRPLVSRLNKTPIRNAQPFTIPVEGDFTGIADHVEKTAVNAPGTLALGEATVTPKAVSGSYELTRELVDSSNPAIDGIALRAMLRDYRRVSEDKAIAAIVAADASVTLSIADVAALKAELIDFVDDDGLGADFVAMSREFAKAMALDTDTTERPLLTRVNPVNAPGVQLPGSTHYEIEGAELIRVPRMAADTAALIRTDGILFAESATQQFRFEQPKGPGIIILALWGYVGAGVLRATDVERVTTAAA